MSGKSATVAVKFTGDEADLKRALGAVGGEIVDLEKKSGGSFGRIRDTAAGFLGGQAVQAVAAFGAELIGLGQRLEAMQVKAETVFGDWVVDVEQFADSVNESMGMSDEAVVGMMANMADLLKPMGFTNAEAFDMTKQFTELAGALSAWSGGTKSAAEVSEIMSDALLGETDGLKQLGISLDAAEVEQRAMAMTGKANADQLTDTERALATQALILEKSTDAQKAWNDGSMDGIKKSNEMKAAWEDQKAALAEKLLPVAQAITKWIVDDFIPAAQATAAWINENIVPAIQSMAAWIDEHVVPALQRFGAFMRDDVGPALQAIGGFIRDYVIPPIATLIEWWVKLHVKVGEIIGGIGTRVDEFVGFFVGLPGRLAGIGDGMFDFLWDAFKAPINLIIDAWNKLGENFRVEFGGWDPPGPGSIPGFTSPRLLPHVKPLADGGVVTGPVHALIGEGGEPELVLPLSAAASMGFGGGGTHVTVQVIVPPTADLAEVGRQIKRAIAEYERVGG